MIKILIVDDYKENIVALSQLVPKENVEIFSATNADEALELVSRHEFGLALLDVQMPVTSGFELASIIRSVKKFKTLPIIFVTAHQEDSSLIFKGYQSGAVDLLFKPLDPNVVRAKVQTFVELAQQRALLQSQVEELEGLRLAADSANLAKSQFLANMSHEIRTPLAAVMGFAEIITKGRVSAVENEEFVAAIKRNGDLLMRLIDDILDLSKIEANRLELRHVPFDLSELLRDAESTMAFRAKENSVALEFNFPQTLHSKYISDPVRIKQVLLNIIGNAIKFSPSGGLVRVDVQTSKGMLLGTNGHSIERLIISVSDEGIGISKEQSERLFQPFVQADPSMKRHFGGSGLGLFIARQIARATGGDVRLASSKEGKGSVFEIELRMQRMASGQVVAQSDTLLASDDNENILHGKRILAVDDCADNLMLISLFLDDSGAEIVYAENGMKAIAEAKEKDFDLILMDVQMPGMDGHETTMEIRRLGFRNPILALTAHALTSEHEKCIASGCNGVLTKPISQERLVQNLRNFLRAKPAARIAVRQIEKL